MCRGFESHPSSSFFFSEKKELFGLVASPFFLFIEKSFHVHVVGCEFRSFGNNVHKIFIKNVLIKQKNIQVSCFALLSSKIISLYEYTCIIRMHM